MHTYWAVMSPALKTVWWQFLYWRRRRETIAVTESVQRGTEAAQE